MHDHEPDHRPAGTSGRKVLLVLLGLGGTLLAILLYMALGRDGTWSPLTAAALESARQRWQQSGVESYTLEVEVFGRQPAVYRVEVRRGRTRSATRNGAPLRQQRTWGTWSVPGMFDTIERDLAHIERVAEGRADASTPRLTVRVQFDQQYGLPRRYLRIERAGIGGNPEVRWEVRQFAPAGNEQAALRKAAAARGARARPIS